MTTPDYRNKTAFVFPGIGVAWCGEETVLFDQYRDIFTPFFDACSSVAHTDLSLCLISGQADTYTALERQLATYAFSTGMARIFTNKNIIPDFLAGYSFGIYPAIVCAGSLSFSDGISLLHEAYTIMETACIETRAAACAVIGLPLSDIELVLRTAAAPGTILTNSNNAYCHVLCGPESEMDQVRDGALHAGAINCVDLAVSHPYHHPVLAAGTDEKLSRFLDTLAVCKPLLPVVSTIDGTLLTDADTLKMFVAAHLCRPINWLLAVETLQAMGVAHMYECGPGISLSQNGRFIPGQLRWTSVKNCRKRRGL